MTLTLGSSSPGHPHITGRSCMAVIQPVSASTHTSVGRSVGRSVCLRLSYRQGKELHGGRLPILRAKRTRRCAHLFCDTGELMAVMQHAHTNLRVVIDVIHVLCVANHVISRAAASQACPDEALPRCGVMPGVALLLRLRDGFSTADERCASPLALEPSRESLGVAAGRGGRAHLSRDGRMDSCEMRLT